MTEAVIAPPTEKMTASGEPSRRGRHRARIMVREARKALSNQQKLDPSVTQIVFDVSDIMSAVRTDDDRFYIREYVTMQGGAWIEGEDHFAFRAQPHD